MDFETLVNTRRSVRGFKKQPVLRAVIEEVIEVAKRAPSSMNTQPWHIYVRSDRSPNGDSVRYVGFDD